MDDYYLLATSYGIRQINPRNGQASGVVGTDSYEPLMTIDGVGLDVRFRALRGLVHSGDYFWAQDYNSRAGMSYLRRINPETWEVTKSDPLAYAALGYLSGRPDGDGAYFSSLRGRGLMRIRDDLSHFSVDSPTGLVLIDDGKVLHTVDWNNYVPRNRETLAVLPGGATVGWPQFPVTGLSNVWGGYWHEPTGRICLLFESKEWTGLATFEPGATTLASAVKLGDRAGAADEWVQSVGPGYSSNQVLAVWGNEYFTGTELRLYQLDDNLASIESVTTLSTLPSYIADDYQDSFQTAVRLTPTSKWLVGAVGFSEQPRDSCR